MRPFLTVVFLSALIFAQVSAADWTQFRGPGGAGLSDAKGAPLKWSDTEGLVWKTDLPGPGASSPRSEEHTSELQSH